MKNVDVLFTNAHVLTINERFHQYSPGAVAVQGDSIVAVGPQDDMIADYTGRETVDCGGKILMPGLINVHTHVPMTLLRGLADDLRLDVWLMGYIMPVGREFVSPDFVKLGTKLACAEMIKGGTTTFADMYYFEDEIAEATKECGMRAVLGQTVLKFPTPDAKFFEEGLALTREFIRKWKGDALIVPAVAPHAPYTCTPKILKAATDLAVEFNVPVHIHLAETAGEVEGIRKESGMPVIPYMRKIGLLDAKVIAAHCVHIDEGEIRMLQSSGAGVAHNPSSNLKLASGAAPVKRMMELNVNVGIGTDGPASNNDLDMFEEIRLTSFLAKLKTGYPTSLSARDCIMMATRGGAKALHIADLTGSIQPGKRADLILVDINTTHNLPRFNRDPDATYAALVYATKSTDVSDVMINGQWVMKNRDLKTVDEQMLVSESADYAHRIDAFLAKREQSLLSKLVAIGGAMEEESFEIQVKVETDDPEPIFKKIESPKLKILRSSHYRQFDTYFLFEEPELDRIRYREDEMVDEHGNVTNVRARLTLIGPTSDEDDGEKVFLSRSRYLAPAVNTLRFYREYFRPESEIEIQKDRKRFLVEYRDTEFFINIDKMTKPDGGYFLEIKSRTWSKEDAEQKTKLIADLLKHLGADKFKKVQEDYLDFVYKR